MSYPFFSSAFYPRLKERYSKQWFKPYWCRIPASYTQTSLSGPTRSLSSPSGNRRWNPVSQYRSFIRQILPSLPISHLFVVSCSYRTSLKNDCPELEQELKMEGAAVGSDSDPGLLATLLKKGGQGSPLYMGKRGYHGLTNRYILAPRAVSCLSGYLFFTSFYLKLHIIPAPFVTIIAVQNPTHKRLRRRCGVMLHRWLLYLLDGLTKWQGWQAPHPLYHFLAPTKDPL